MKALREGPKALEACFKNVEEIAHNIAAGLKPKPRDAKV